jgi:hypothetical protein
MYLIARQACLRAVGFPNDNAAQWMPKMSGTHIMDDTHETDGGGFLFALTCREIISLAT